MGAQTTLHLAMTDWLALIFGTLLFIVVIALILMFRQPERRNNVVVRVHKAKHSPIVIDASDRSVRQTQIDAQINVQVPPLARPERGNAVRPRGNSSSRGDDEMQAVFMAVAAAVLLLVPLYLRYFEPVLVWTRGWYFALFAYSALGWLVGVTGLIKPVGSRHQWFAVQCIVSGLGAVVLLNGQDLIAPAMVDVARDAPLSVAGALGVFKRLTWHGRLLALGSGVMCALAALNALLTTAAIWRSCILSFWQVEDMGPVARVVLRSTQQAGGSSFVVRAAVLLSLAIGVRYLWLPHAIGL